MRSKWQEVADPGADASHDALPNTGDPWIGIDEAARHLAVPTRTLYLLAQRKQVPAVKVGRAWRFKRSALDARLRNADSVQTATALADLSVELGGLADLDAIALNVSNRLREIFGVELAGLMRLDGEALETVVPSDRLDVPSGTRFPLSSSAVLRQAINSLEPTVYEDLQPHQAPSIDIIGRFGIRGAVFVPIRRGDAIWGLLSLATLTPRRFSPTETDRLVSIASQVGLAVNNASLLAETRRWSEQLERIEALTAQLSRSRGVNDVADAVAREIDSVIDWHGLRFYVLEADGQTLEPIKLRSKVDHYSHETPELVRLSLGKGLGGHIAASGVPEVINDAARDPRGSRIPGTEESDESMIVVPLIYEDRVLGVLELFRLGLNAFDATDLRVAQIIGSQAAIALSNARQLEEMERRRDALERRVASQRQLLAITERLLVQRERGAVFESIADTLAEVVPHDTLTIYLVDADQGCLVPILARDEYAEQILASRPALGSGITGDVIANGEAEIINDAENDPRVVHVPGTPTDEDESMIVAPIRNTDSVVGALNLYRVGRDFDAEDLELVRLFTNHVAIALDNATIHDQLVDAALTDPLTGLPNRRLFAERIDHALARRERARQPRRRPLSGRRQLQDGQRRIGARGRGWGARGSRASAAGMHAPGGHGGAPGRRRVRDSARGRWRGRRRACRRTTGRGPIQPPGHRRSHGSGASQHRGCPGSRRDEYHLRRAPAGRGHGHVPGQGHEQGLVPDLRAGHACPTAGSPAARQRAARGARTWAVQPALPTHCWLPLGTHRGGRGPAALEPPVAGNRALANSSSSQRNRGRSWRSAPGCCAKHAGRRAPGSGRFGALESCGSR